MSFDTTDKSIQNTLFKIEKHLQALVLLKMVDKQDEYIASLEKKEIKKPHKEVMIDGYAKTLRDRAYPKDSLL